MITTTPLEKKITIHSEYAEQNQCPCQVYLNTKGVPNFHSVKNPKGNYLLYSNSDNTMLHLYCLSEVVMVNSCNRSKTEIFFENWIQFGNC